MRKWLTIGLVIGLVCLALLDIGAKGCLGWRKHSHTGSSAPTQTSVRVDDTGLGMEPSLKIDSSGNIYIAWQDDYTGNPTIYHPDIYFAKSTDGGLSFGPGVRVNDNTEEPQVWPSLSVDDSGNNVYIVWRDDRTGSSEIYFAKSTNGGTSFGPNVRVNDNADTNHPSIAIDGSGNIYVVWQYYVGSIVWKIYFAKSTNGGSSFEPMVAVASDGNKDQRQADIAVDDSENIYVVWYDDRNDNHDIYFAKSTNGGTSFDGSVRVDDTGAGSISQDTPSIAIAPNNDIYVVWYDNRNGSTWDIYFAKSTDGGTSFGTNIKVNDMGTIPSLGWDGPSIAVDGAGNIYVAWADKRNGDFDIYLAKSTDEGDTFNNSIRVNDVTANDQKFPSLAVDNTGNVYLAWQDDRAGTSDPHIYFTKNK